MNHKKRATRLSAASSSPQHLSHGAQVIQMPQKQYDQMVKKASPASTYVKNCIMAFLFGGGICAWPAIIWGLYAGRINGNPRPDCRVGDVDWDCRRADGF